MRGNKENLKVEFMLVCDYAYTSDAGKLSLVGKFETIFVKELPASHAEMFIVAHFSGPANTEHNIKVRIEDPQNKDLVPPKAPEIKLRLSGSGTGNLLHRLLNFPIKNTGGYKISLYEAEKEIGSTNFSVIRVKKGDETGNPAN